MQLTSIDDESMWYEWFYRNQKLLKVYMESESTLIALFPLNDVINSPNQFRIGSIEQMMSVAQDCIVQLKSLYSDSLR